MVKLTLGKQIVEKRGTYSSLLEMQVQRLLDLGVHKHMGLSVKEFSAKFNDLRDQVAKIGSNELSDSLTPRLLLVLPPKFVDFAYLVSLCQVGETEDWKARTIQPDESALSLCLKKHDDAREKIESLQEILSVRARLKKAELLLRLYRREGILNSLSQNDMDYLRILEVYLNAQEEDDKTTPSQVDRVIYYLVLGLSSHIKQREIPILLTDDEELEESVLDDEERNELTRLKMEVVSQSNGAEEIRLKIDRYQKRPPTSVYVHPSTASKAVDSCPQEEPYLIFDIGVSGVAGEHYDSRRVRSNLSESGHRPVNVVELVNILIHAPEKGEVAHVEMLGDGWQLLNGKSVDLGRYGVHTAMRQRVDGRRFFCHLYCKK